MLDGNGRSRRLVTLLLAAALVLVAGWRGAPPPASAATQGEIAAALSARLADPTAAQGDAAEQRAEAALRRFYEARGFAPVWSDADGLLPRGRALLALLEHADQEGLAPDDYDIGPAAALLQEGSAESLARLEHLLSRSLIRYALDLRYGRIDPGRLDPKLFTQRHNGDPYGILADAAQSPDITAYLAGMAPRAREYARLKAALAFYREIARKGGWKPFPDGETLKPGMRDPRVPLLRARLIQLGDLRAASSGTELYDEALQAAVRRFQYRHGLDQDAAVGRKTRAALNVPVEQRIEQMILNLERRRWMATDRYGFYIFVNMADFALKVVDGDDTIFDTRVVVGTSYNQTPVFNGTMTYVELNPFWNVPPSIARKEMLPKIRKDVGYLGRENLRVFSGWGDGAQELDPQTIDWSAVSRSRFPYKLRQDPGPDNALGRIKFMFPNRFNVYMHDTPARSLFQRSVRSFSHGCIRVQNPLELGEIVLRGNAGWTRERLETEIATGRRQIITLERPIPVYLTYLTAWANKDGSIHFRDDIYGRDKRLAEALRLSHIAMAQ